jgi:hypothetical protein
MVATIDEFMKLSCNMVKKLPVGALPIEKRKRNFQNHKQTAVQLVENHLCILGHLPRYEN